MTKRTTESWESLLDCATPGPWRWYWDHGTMTLEGADIMPVATGLHVHDSDLLAATPEAVAEVVRLRRALEELRDCYRHREARSRERLESVTDEREQSYLARFAHSHRRTHEALTRILEGDTDE